MADQFFKKFAAQLEDPQAVPVAIPATETPPTNNKVNWFVRLWRALLRLF
jgi:hypothetical protein